MNQNPIEGQDQGGKLILWANRFAPLRRLGWAFLLAWIFCVFYTRAVEGYAGKSEIITSQIDLIGQIYFIGLPGFMSVLTLIAIIAAENKFGTPTDHRTLTVAAPILTALSTVMLLWQQGTFLEIAIVFTLGSMLAGLGSGLMWVMWGEYYTRISQDLVEHLAPASAIIAAVLVLIVSAMSGWVATFVVVVFPLLSGLCFFLSWKDVEQGIDLEPVNSFEQTQLAAAHNEARKSPLHALKGMWRTGLGIFTACMFGSLEGSFWIKSEAGSFEFQLVLLVSIAFTAFIAYESTSGPRRIGISFLYRWMCPTIVLGYVVMVLFKQGLGDYLAFMILIAVRFTFCLITQMYFARYAAQGKATAVQSFGLGWLFVHAADFLGIVVFRLLIAGFEAELFTFDQFAVTSIGILIAVTMFVLNDEKSFAEERPELGSAERSMRDEANRDAPAFEHTGLENNISIVAREFDLTPRESEVLELLARGRSVPYIRDVLFISKGTVATHVKSIYAKLDVHSRQELIDLVDRA